MLEFTVISQEMNATINRLNDLMVHTGSISEEFENWSQKKIDKRDFKPMTLLLDEPETGTPEEKQAAMDEQIRAMERAFYEGREDEKKVYLDRMYDLRDSFDPEALDLTDEKDRKKLIAYVALNQTFGTKCTENQDYYNARYDTPEKRMEADILNRYSVAVATLMMDSLRKEGQTLKTQLTLPASMPGKEDYVQMFYDIAKSDVERLKAVKEGREPNPVTTIRLPKDMKQFNSLPPLEKLSQVPSDTSFEATAVGIIGFASTYMLTTEQGDLLKEAHLTKNDMIFIDGKSLSEIQQEKYPNLQGGYAFDMCNLILAKALTSGENRIEIAQLERTADQTFQVKLNPVRPDLSDVQPSLKEDYGWFRRTLFNWGPFRCKTRQEKADDLIARDPEKGTRQASIAEKVNAKIAPALEKRREAAARAEREQTSIKELAGPNREQSLGKTKVQERSSEKQKSIEV